MDPNMANTTNTGMDTAPEAGTSPYTGATPDYSQTAYNGMTPDMQQTAYNGMTPDMQQQAYNGMNPNMQQAQPFVGGAVPTPAPAKQKKKNSKAASVLGIILLIGLAVFLIASAIVDLVGVSGAKKLSSDYTEAPQEGDYVDASFNFGGTAGTMKHTINFIPVGTEYYYIVLNDSVDQAIFIRADKNWGDNFNAQNYASSPVNVKGKVRKMDYKLKKELVSDVNDLTRSGINVATDKTGSNYLFIDNQTTKVSIYKLVGFGLFVLAAIFCFLLTKIPADVPGEMSHQTKRTVYGAIVAVGFIAGAILILHILTTYF